MKIKTTSGTAPWGTIIEDSEHRAVIDTVHHEVRVFKHYRDALGKPKLRLEKTLTLPQLLKKIVKKEK